MPTPLLISKSHMEAFWGCQRAGYWAYVHAGGVQKVGEQFDLEYGKVIHEALRWVATDRRGRLTHEKFTDNYAEVRQLVEEMCLRIGREEDAAKQWGSIAEGSIRGFVASVWPKLMAEYTVAHVEVPCVLPLGEEIYYVAIPDLILQHKVTGEYWYVEYKTTGARFDAGWIEQWDSAVQVHAGIRAAEATLGIAVAGCLVIGLSKGYRNSYDGTQQSPFAWGWVRRGSPGVVPDQYQIVKPKYWKGWERFPTSSLQEGLAGWVDRMQAEAPEVLEAQYCVTPPILVQDKLVGGFLDQVKLHGQALREYEKAERAYHLDYTEQPHNNLDSLRDLYFPQTFSACKPAFGRKCGYRDACWTEWIGEDPAGSGMYQARSVEHQQPFIKLLEVHV